MPGDVIGGAEIVISANDTPLAQLMQGLKERLIVQPITGAASFIYSALSAPFEALKGVVTAPFSALTGALSPVMDAMSHSLADFGHWTQMSIEAESRQARFNAILAQTGPIIGYTTEQLARQRKELEGMSSFSGKDIMQAQQTLARSGFVRGDNYESAMRLMIDLGAQMGDLGEAAHVLEMSLTHPEAALRLLRHAGIMVNQQQMEMASGMIKSGDVAKGQAIILEMLRGKVGAVGEAMAQTTEGKLAKLTQGWNKIGKSIGDVLSPITGAVAEVTGTLVNMLGGALTPTLGRMAGSVNDWSKNVSAWLKENSATWKEWSGLLGEIVGNIADYVGGKLKSFFNIDMSGAEGAWSSLKEKVTDALDELSVYTMDIDGMWEDITSKAGELWDNLKAYASPALSWLEDKFLALWDRVTTYLSDAFYKVVGGFGDYLRDVSDYMPKIFGYGPGDKLEEFADQLKTIAEGKLAHPESPIARAVAEGAFGGGGGFGPNEKDERRKDLMFYRDWLRDQDEADAAAGRGHGRGSDIYDGGKAKGGLVGIEDISSKITQSILESPVADQQLEQQKKIADNTEKQIEWFKKVFDKLSPTEASAVFG